jgi:pimeloyl-ACP methyl ester carboxylesterase
MGDMQIPNGPLLKIGLEVFKKADGQWGGNVTSMDQGNRYITVSSIHLSKQLLTVTLQGAPITIEGQVSVDHSAIKTEFKQGGHAFPLILVPVEQIEESYRPQTPTDFSQYLIEEVNYQNSKDQTWLSGTLTLPKGEGKSPAVMLIAGSGPSHRDAYHSGHRPLMVLADYLTQRGFVVLRSDKRGVYKSSGSFSEGEVDHFAQDTQAAIQFLKNHDSVNADQIFLIGHSEGSMVAAMASLQEPVKGIVSLAGPGMSTLDILLLQDQTEPRAKGASEADIKVLYNFSQKFYQAVLDENDPISRKAKLQALYDGLSPSEAAIHQQWNDRIGTLNVNTASSDQFKTFLQQDPLDTWRQIKIPVLVINGGKDAQVSAEQNVGGLLKALKGNPAKVSQQIFPNLNHMLQTATTGATDEYAQIDQTLAPEVMKTMVQWLLQQL